MNFKNKILLEDTLEVMGLVVVGFSPIWIIVLAAFISAAN